MDNMSAFIMGQVTQDKEQMVFDWNKAARLIVESGTNKASAGLCGDWEYTGDSIFSNGKPVKKEDTCVYLASTWATPEIEINGIVVDCFIMVSKSPNGKWDKDTHWPISALKILKGTN